MNCKNRSDKMEIKTEFVIKLDLTEIIDIKKELSDIINGSTDESFSMIDIEVFDTLLYGEIKKVRDRCNNYLE